MQDSQLLNSPAKTIDDLAEAWVWAKREEVLANARRVEIEQQIIERIGAKFEGAFTAKGDHYKITTTGKLSRSVDWQKYEQDIAPKIPENLRPVDYKPQLNTTGLRYLELNEPEFYRLMTQCISTKSAKTAVTVAPIDPMGGAV